VLTSNDFEHMPESDARLALIREWLSRDLRLPLERLEPASSDASFRRYLRAWVGGSTYIVMDAPPEKEDTRPYLKVSAMLESMRVHVPHVHEQDIPRGLLLLEDLGTTLYLERLRAGDDAGRLYDDALRALAAVQVRGREAARALPPYDAAALARELALLPEWFLERHLALQLSAGERELLAASEAFLIAEALAQPQVFVHRDYHSRNLMLTAERNPGVLDFQDALCGPVGYDLVSLLKDCYIEWPRPQVEQWVTQYRSRLLPDGLAGASGTEFLRWFDLIGVQRHLKVLGIFARLWYRDGKPGYLADLPRTLEYVRDCCGRYRELSELGRFLESAVAPKLPAANARELERAAAVAGAAV